MVCSRPAGKIKLRRERPILRAIGVACWVEERTAAEVRRLPGERSESAPLRLLFDDGCLQLCRMSEQAYETYLSLVSGLPAETLDDGESAAIAIAVHGIGSVVLDDKKARRILSERFTESRCGSSLSFLLAAATRANWSAQDLRAAITAARNVARMAIVPEERPLYAELFTETTAG
ncbi:hypothetical protein GNZ13_22475 [Paraburkholderia sp. 5N]|uniref:Uncharacterized protein n=2 Tax=Paraburkholderia elongata TaxID=2675747 RepID=A0A972NP96_9BURK|nr:hypothetical protein [Paraburkholderia elongata]